MSQNGREVPVAAGIGCIYAAGWLCELGGKVDAIRE